MSSICHSCGSRNPALSRVIPWLDHGIHKKVKKLDSATSSRDDVEYYWIPASAGMTSDKKLSTLQFKD
ncbi:hypothetical protein RFEPED_0136 [Rickettsia felis str. Pedreira]|uniref:Uncharacterized protein n=1 Tax=Rickettsia felis str. Pedreira TaxID=1359196 RepID=A0A0F3MT51_RICFI|nr:hypothetical protein JS61_03565 [Rickettsia felis]KJV57769.1 hypothetical protein RFEPED_0136 [Rickettsia felis str. Pedreira]